MGHHEMHQQLNNTGFHSEIYIHELTRGNKKHPAGKEIVAKVFGIKANGFDMDHAVVVRDSMRRYSEIAEEIGVSVVQPIRQLIVPNGTEGKVNLVQYLPHAGTDLRTIINAPSVSDEAVLGFLDTYFQEFKKVWEDGDFRISLDPVPANFCVDKNGKLTYVDSMPPRQKISDTEYLSEWPDPPEESRAFIEARYFSHLQSRVIYAQLMRAVNGRDISPDQLKEAIKNNLGQQAYDDINFTDDEKTRILEYPDQTDVDSIRCLAGEAHYRGELSTQQLKAVFELAHIVNGGILPSLHEVREAVAIIKDPENATSTK